MHKNLGSKPRCHQEKKWKEPVQGDSSLELGSAAASLFFQLWLHPSPHPIGWCCPRFRGIFNAVGYPTCQAFLDTNLLTHPQSSYPWHLLIQWSWKLILTMTYRVCHPATRWEETYYTSPFLPGVWDVSPPRFSSGDITTASLRLICFPQWVPYTFAKKSLTADEIHRVMKQPTTDGALQHICTFAAQLLAFTS